MPESFNRQIIEDMLATAGERKAREWLGALGLRQAMLDLDRVSAERRARHLLDQGWARPAVRDRLMQTFGISPRSAYRAIDAALRQRGS